MNIGCRARGGRLGEAENGGQQKLPTVDLDGQILSIPTEPELEAALRGKGLSGVRRLLGDCRRSMGFPTALFNHRS